MPALTEPRVRSIIEQVVSTRETSGTGGTNGVGAIDPLDGWSALPRHDPVRLEPVPFITANKQVPRQKCSNERMISQAIRVHFHQSPVIIQYLKSEQYRSLNRSLGFNIELLIMKDYFRCEFQVVKPLH